MSARRSGQKLKSSGSVMDGDATDPSIALPLSKMIGTRGTFCVGDVDVVAAGEDVVVEW